MRKFTAVAFMCASLGALAAPAIASPDTRPAVVQVEPNAVALPSQQELDADAARYAQAERAQPKAQEFVGGSTVVIAASTTTIVLAIILLLVLL